MHGMGGVCPLTFGPSHVSTSFRLIPFLFTFLRTLLHSGKAQPFYFQSIPHSLPKTTRGGGTPLLSAIPNPTVPLLPIKRLRTLSTITLTPVTQFSYLWVATMRRRLLRIALILLLFPPLLAAVAGSLARPTFLPPHPRQITPGLLPESVAPPPPTPSTPAEILLTTTPAAA